MRLKKHAYSLNGKISQGGRGALLEDMINFTNEIYKRRGLALVQKIPTPITPIQMNGPIITKAFFAEKSTVDYIGVADGRGICFDAKECRQKTFPLKNIHEHQYLFMNEFQKNGGTTFMVLYYSIEEVFYLLTMEELRIFYQRMEDGGRKSISFDELQEDHFFNTGETPVPYIEKIRSMKLG